MLPISTSTYIIIYIFVNLQERQLIRLYLSIVHLVGGRECVILCAKTLSIRRNERRCLHHLLSLADLTLPP
jgi:hypothetical protein